MKNKKLEANLSMAVSKVLKVFGLQNSIITWRHTPHGAV